MAALAAGGCAKDEAPPSITSSQAIAQRNDSMEMVRQYAVWAATHPGGGAMPLEFSNDLHYRVIRNRLVASGKTTDNSPEAFSRLGLARTKALKRAGAASVTAAPWCGQDLPFSEHSPGHFGAKSIFSCTGGSDYSYASVATYSTTSDLSNFLLLESTSLEDFEQKSIKTPEVSGNATPAPGRILFFDVVTLAFNDSDEYSGYQPAKSSNFVPDRDATLTIDHPKEIQGNTGDNPIRLCMYRNFIAGGPHQDCDYGTVKKNANGTFDPFVSSGATGVAAAIPNASNVQWTPDPNAYFPATGAITYNYPTIMPYVPIKGHYDSGAVNRMDCLNVNTTGTARLFLLETGGMCTGVAVGGPVTGTVTLPGTPNPNSSLWDFSGVLDFGNTCLTNQQAVTMTINITNDACGGGRGKTIELPAMDFRNSCLAEGTLVAMASGKSVAVEKLEVGDKVVTNRDGRVLTVQGVSHGAEPFAMVRIKDDKRHEVIVTTTHPMLLESGSVVAAAKLAVGDHVMTDRGPTRLIAVERIKHDKQVYNFVLGTQDELASVGPGERTLFANGFLVGDSVMQRELEDRSKPSRPETLAQLPAAWHRDYEAAMQRKAVSAR